MMIGLVAGLAGTVMSARAQAMAGKEQARAALFEEQQYRIQEETAKTAAAQSEARRREELNANLETIQTLRAGRGVGMSSPTGLAILNSTEDAEMRDMRTEKLSHLMRSDQARMAADMSARRAKHSLLAGKMSAGATLFSGAASAFNTVRSFG